MILLFKQSANAFFLMDAHHSAGNQICDAKLLYLTGIFYGFSGIDSGVLVDPFMGSGTSAIAALNCGLDYVGFDIDQNYIDFAQDRIAEHELNTFALHFEVDTN